MARRRPRLVLQPGCRRSRLPQRRGTRSHRGNAPTCDCGARRARLAAQRVRGHEHCPPPCRAGPLSCPWLLCWGPHSQPRPLLSESTAVRSRRRSVARLAPRPSARRGAGGRCRREGAEDLYAMLWRSLPDWRHGFGTSSGQSRAPGLMAPFDASTRARPTMEGSRQRPQRAPPAIAFLATLPNTSHHGSSSSSSSSVHRPRSSQNHCPL
mmetsp:Transcript_15430/g.58388  ORF Transcript_15430/g.58388 Transcript_15430/m.58388 type:complete len:210 (+) Transcript_15430:2665-3294(+)